MNANGRPATYYFEYGKTTSYGDEDRGHERRLGHVARVGPAAITGLAASTTYHFRLVATSDAGTVLGNDVTFTTAGTPVRPSVTTKAATSVTLDGAKLNGAVNPGGQTTTWYFDYGTTTGYGQKTPCHDRRRHEGRDRVRATSAASAPASATSGSSRATRRERRTAAT